MFVSSIGHSLSFLSFISVILLIPLLFFSDFFFPKNWSRMRDSSYIHTHQKKNTHTHMLIIHLHWRRGEKGEWKLHVQELIDYLVPTSQLRRRNSSDYLSSFYSILIDGVGAGAAPWSNDEMWWVLIEWCVWYQSLRKEGVRVHTRFVKKCKSTYTPYVCTYCTRYLQNQKFHFEIEYRRTKKKFTTLVPYLRNDQFRWEHLTSIIYKQIFSRQISVADERYCRDPSFDRTRTFRIRSFFSEAHMFW